MKRFIPTLDGDYINEDLIRYFSVRKIPLENYWYIVAYLNEFDGDGNREYYYIASDFKTEECAYEFLDNILKED